MNDSRSYITLDFRNTHMPVVVKAKRGDTARTLYISLADGGTPYQIADGCTATFTAKKPDKTVINNICTIEGNMIVYPFTDHTCSKDGRMTAEIRLYGSNGRMLTSASFVLEIHKTVLGPNDIPASEDEMNALDALILETTALKSETQTLKEIVEQKLENGEFIGDTGKSAYEYAIDGGYTGSEEAFSKKLAAEFKDLNPAMKLIAAILKETLFVSDQSEQIKKLSNMVEDVPGGNVGGDASGSVATKKLSAPVIRLERIAEPDNPIKLSTPIIRLITSTDVDAGGTSDDVGGSVATPKLPAPVIRFETTDDTNESGISDLRYEDGYLKWSTVDGAGQYQVRYQNDDTLGYHIVSTAKNQIPVAAVQGPMDAAYLYTVYALNNGEEICGSNTITYTAPQKTGDASTPSIYLEEDPDTGAMFVRGESAEVPTWYELWYMSSEYSWDSIASSDEINFDLSSYELLSGDVILAVTAETEYGRASEKSNEVVYTASAD